MISQKLSVIYAALALLGCSSFVLGQQSTQKCQELASLNLSNGVITIAEIVGEGEFDEARGNFGSVPEFCRVGATMSPSTDSDIKMELWLPTQNWNGKYVAVGNGAFTGNVRHSALVQPLSRGYAASSIDTGHLGNTASFGLGHPEKVMRAWRMQPHQQTSQTLI